MSLKVLELFSGIGAFSKALDRIGVEHEIVDAVEVDKYAMTSFNAIHNTNFEVQDICKWDKDIDVDFIMHGSPCQDFSVAGLQAGGDLRSGTRSSLMWETVRIVGKLRPKYVMWENVKNLLSKKHKHNFDAYIETMDILGYNSYYQVLNAKDYGIPQNRERVYTISIRKDIDDKKFKFPEKEELKLRLKDLLDKEVDEKYYLSDAQIDRIHTTTYNVGKTRIQEKEYCDTLCARDWKDPKCVQVGTLDIKGHDCVKRVYSNEGISPTLTDMQGENGLSSIVSTIDDIKVIKDSVQYQGKEIELPAIAASRGRNPENPSDRTPGTHTEQRLEINTNGTSNTLTSVQKDNYVLESTSKEGYVEKKYNNFIKENGYVPQMFNPYNESEIKDIAPTQSTQCGSTTSSATILKNDGYRIRKLTPKECWRLMNFTDEEFEKAQEALNNTYYKGRDKSSSQLYKQARKLNSSKCIREDIE